MTQLAAGISIPSSAVTVATSRFDVPAANESSRRAASEQVMERDGVAGDVVAYRPAVVRRLLRCVSQAITYSRM